MVVSRTVILGLLALFHNIGGFAFVVRHRQNTCIATVNSNICGRCVVEFKSPRRVNLFYVTKNDRVIYSNTALGLTAEPGNEKIGKVAFVAGSKKSGFGRTSPKPYPSWTTVAEQLSRRLPNFAGLTDDGNDRILSNFFEASSVKSLEGYDVVVALGIDSDENDDEKNFFFVLEKAKSSIKVVLADPTCEEAIRLSRFSGDYGVTSLFNNIASYLFPWSRVASHKRLFSKTDTLISRNSSEDLIFAVLFALHSLVLPIDVVKSDINPSWEKGVIGNIKEFSKMVDCCGPQIFAALGDPKTKNAIDLLNAVDLRDQVGSYRVIVSNETPQLEEFTLCILQQNDCFNCDSPILTRPAVPLLQKWKGQPLTFEASKQIMIGHLDHPSAHPKSSTRQPWSWKIVVGANPAYDAFPMQHQIFYPSGSSSNVGSSSLWYDPVFCVETLDGDLVWCKRHYRCTPRQHWSATDIDGPTPGAWTLTTLDNGMVSEEKWTIVDADDELSWAVLHYSGAARRAGQSYVGALLCTADGKWPANCESGENFERIRQAFQKCDLALWELFGGSTNKSFMWSSNFLDWAKENPPPLDRIGDISITKWRKQEREKAMQESLS